MEGRRQLVLRSFNEEGRTKDRDSIFNTSTIAEAMADKRYLIQVKKIG